LRLFSRSGGGGGGPLTRKRLFCIIHEFFIRFVHHPPGNCIHTRIYTYTHTHIRTYTYTYLYIMYNMYYIYNVYIYIYIWCAVYPWPWPQVSAADLRAHALYNNNNNICTLLHTHIVHMLTCRRTHTCRFTHAYYFRLFWREQRSGAVNRVPSSSSVLPPPLLHTPR